METLYGRLYFLQSHDFMCEMYFFFTFVTTSPDFRVESCLFTFPLPSIFHCVTGTSRCAFLPTSLFASCYERLGQTRIIPFIMLCTFPPFLLARFFGIPERKIKLVISTVCYVFPADGHTACLLLSNQIFSPTFI